jgi:hypothetical protein
VCWPLRGGRGTQYTQKFLKIYRKKKLSISTEREEPSGQGEESSTRTMRGEPSVQREEPSTRTKRVAIRTGRGVVNQGKKRGVVHQGKERGVNQDRERSLRPPGQKEWSHQDRERCRPSGQREGSHQDREKSHPPGQRENNHQDRERSIRAEREEPINGSTVYQDKQRDGKRERLLK